MSKEPSNKTSDYILRATIIWIIATIFLCLLAYAFTCSRPTEPSPISPPSSSKLYVVNPITGVQEVYTVVTNSYYNCEYDFYYDESGKLLLLSKKDPDCIQVIYHHQKAEE